VRLSVDDEVPLVHASIPFRHDRMDLVGFYVPSFVLGILFSSMPTQQHRTATPQDVVGTAGGHHKMSWPPRNYARVGMESTATGRRFYNRLPAFHFLPPDYAGGPSIGAEGPDVWRHGNR